MPMLQAPHGATASAYGASAKRVRREGHDEIEIDLGLSTTSDILVSMPVEVAHALARSIKNCLDDGSPMRGGGWLAGLRWRRRAG